MKLPPYVCGLLACIGLISATSGVARGAGKGPKIPTTVEVRSDRILLADLLPHAPAVDLGPAPAAGKRRVLAGAVVRSRATAAGVSIGRIPKRIVVARASRRLEATEISAWIETAVRERVPHDDVEIRSLTPGTAVVPAGELGHRIDLTRGSKLVGKTRATVVVTVDGREVKRLVVVADLVRRGPTLVAVRPLARGHIFGPADVRRVTKVRTPAVPFPLVAPSDVVGMRLRRPLAAEEAVTAKLLETVPIVGKGETVLLLVRIGAISATARGRALEAGARGEDIAVTNVASGKRLRGIVRDSSTVEVRR